MDSNLQFHHVVQLFANVTVLCNSLWISPCFAIVFEFPHTTYRVMLMWQCLVVLLYNCLWISPHFPVICEFYVVQFFLNFTMLCNYCWISSHCAIISECHHTTHRVMLMWVFLLLLSSIVYKIPWILPCCANILNFTMLCNCLWFLMYVHTDGWMTDGRSEWWTVKSWCLRIFRS